MNNEDKQKYQELIHLTRLFLIRESFSKNNFTKHKRGAMISPPSKKDPKEDLSIVPPPECETTRPVENIENPEPMAKKTPVLQDQAQKKLVLDPPSLGDDKDFKSLQALYTSLFSSASLRKGKLSDIFTNKSKIKVILLSFNNDIESLSLLKNIAQAITAHYFPAEVILVKERLANEKFEETLFFSDLKLICACESELRLEPKLMNYYLRSEQGHFLKHIPLLLLPDIKQLINEPSLKAHLWKTLKNYFSVIGKG